MKRKKQEEKEENPEEKKTGAEEEEEESSSLSVPHSLFTSFPLQNFSDQHRESRTVLRFCLAPGAAAAELPKF